MSKPQQIDRRAFMGGFLAVGTMGATGAAVLGNALQDAQADPIAALIDSAGADADLLAAGRDFETAWEAERAAWHAHDAATRAGLQQDGETEWEAAFEATRATVDRIEALPATTPAGLMVKARAALWCYDGDLADMLHDVGELATSTRLAYGIVADVLRMSAPAA